MIPISMNPADIAKDAIRIVTTAGLSKDVIDLLEKKVALLTDTISMLDQEKSVLNGENVKLQKQIVDLQEELDRLRPKQDGLEEVEVKFLQLLAQHNFMSVREIAASLGISKVKAEYHRDELKKKALLRTPMIVQAGQEAYALGEKGRAYLAKRGLI
jgi:predicted DNA-binding transcriptional regulator